VEARDLTVDPLAASLVERLEAAFDGSAVPPVDEMIRAPSVDPEAADMRAKFGGRHWRDLTCAELRHEADSVFVFLAAGFHFFLPAFVRCSLLAYREVDLVPDAVVSMLAPPVDPALQDYFDVRAGRLTPTQKSVLKDVVAYFRSRWPNEFDHGDLARAEDWLARP
jgi:hypothetical protein